MYNEMEIELADKYNLSPKLTRVAHEAFCGCDNAAALLFADYMGSVERSSLQDWLVAAQNTPKSVLDAIFEVI